MKYTLKNVKNIKSLTRLSIVAGVGLAIASLAYLDSSRRLELTEHDTALTTKLVEAAQLNALLRDMKSGRMGSVNERLNTLLTNDLNEITSFSDSTNPGRKEFAKAVVAEIAREQKLHPEYHLAQVTQQ